MTLLSSNNFYCIKQYQNKGDLTKKQQQMWYFVRCGLLVDSSTQVERSVVVKLSEAEGGADVVQH